MPPSPETYWSDGLPLPHRSSGSATMVLLLNVAVYISLMVLLIVAWPFVMVRRSIVMVEVGVMK